ncbi:NADPH-dependent F420 reductase [Micromonospora endophytica]|uniref:NADPH-dependent F420 reductase n=1 Tax=Micromonospora endophytica TaxID=515350 RepID=A0A2W2DK08_9ACTN|nr:NADPH-dependent F420 reductase [Micromonospora endophytica]PZG00078.1 NADPH-dependent F420 reductase [Micromonospora endophytica]RIW47112.1 NADPH-dependent F420 reductase [Micromonospora endophytica]BCJ61013.1 NADPH-dependent F420 reductase [Micromonospora endophytica]
MAYDPSDLPDVSGLTVGIIGGTGDQGRGLAYRFARAGQTVLVGSRSAQRAAESAAEISALPGVPAGGGVTGADNEEVARRSDVVIIAVPWDGHAATLTALAGPLAGKVVVDCVNPLGFDKQGPYALPVPEGSAAQQAAALLPDSRVCAAFHHVSAPLLADPEIDRIDLDVLICTEDRELVGIVGALAARIPGMRGLYAGRLRNAHQIEAFTANLIAVNRRYKAHAGIRVTDV